MFSFASNVYNNLIFFGGYPNKEWFDILLQNNVKIFVDLTIKSEKINYELFNYQEILSTIDDTKYFNFPINDNQIPENIENFKNFIMNLGEQILQLKNNEKIYIHCKGGHSRSGMVSACLLCFLLNITPEKALYITTIAHSNRENLKPKWKNQRCPQIFRQRKFVIDVFKPIFITPNLYEEKISNNLIKFLNETNVRPLRENKDNHILSDVLIHLRKILIKKESNNDITMCL